MSDGVLTKNLGLHGVVLKAKALQVPQAMATAQDLEHRQQLHVAGRQGERTAACGRHESP